ncbi:caspase recruitment domain-containing protein 19 isoform X3 [Paramormyrops kingsleyae]|uniref:caspase recruitment domain-containing protein 19 isoform X3 n=1 Tax=Paramormyrops kingsleyae TaxID=1676925 RepID=UPI000CD5EA47|nr:caspase recruitment domain-containing protein 19 isoform X3 [Paramormyrops kingsleyae]
MADSYREQLIKDSEFLRNDKRMGTELVDKLVLQLNRIYPQILNDKEAQKFRNLGVPTAIRLVELLSHLQGKGEEACYEFYRALHIHAEDVYFSLPTRIHRRGPWFFLSCFTVVVGVAFLYYHSEGKGLGDDTRKVLGFTTLGFGTQAKEVLISYIDDCSRK